MKKENGEKIKIGLVLEGGGARGSYQGGVIKALRKKRISFDCTIGTSIGSINAAFVASGSYRKLYKLWNTVTSKKLLGIDEESVRVFNKDYSVKNLKNTFSELKRIMKNSGIDTSILKKVLKENINEDYLRKSKCDYGLVTFNLTDRKPIEIFKKDIPSGKLYEYIMASAYFPLFKFEKIIDDKYYFDGGIYKDCPYDVLLKENYDKIYVVRAHKFPIIKKDKRITEIKSKNNLGPIIFFSKERNVYNFKLGYYDALKVLDNLDGFNYYFKPYSKDYYENLLSEEIKKEYNLKSSLLRKVNYKKEILFIIESICKEYEVSKFKIYNIKTLLILLKFKMRNNTEHKYYNFISKIKINVLQK